MTSIFANTRFAFLAKKSSSLSDDDISAAPAQPSRALPQVNHSALQIIWLASACLCLMMPVIIRFFRMNTDEWLQQGGMAANESSRVLRFVYAWQIFMFLSIVAYGYHVINHHKSHAMLMGALLVWFQYNFLAMLLLSDSIGGSDMELERFYGQFSVLMFMTNAWYVVHGLIFIFIFAIRGAVSKQHRLAAEGLKDDDADGDGQPLYKRMDTPPSPTGSVGGEDDYVKVV